MVEFILYFIVNMFNIIMNLLELKIKFFYVVCFFLGDFLCYLFYFNSFDYRLLLCYSECC